MKRRNYIILISVILAILVILAGVRLISGEDTWICEDGIWIEHGHPSAPKPTLLCGIDQAQSDQTQGEPQESAYEHIVRTCQDEEQGRWVSLFRECEYASESWCSENGGVYTNCASPCRNMGEDTPENEAYCSETCMPVCKLENI